MPFGTYFQACSSGTYLHGSMLFRTGRHWRSVLNKVHDAIIVRRLIIVLMLALIAGVGSYIVGRSATAPLHLWDEALYANNALDMVRNGHYGVYTVNDTIDHHNTKPPLVLWMQAASGAAIGFSELTVRLPTYCALAGIVVLLIICSRRLSGSLLPGLLAALLSLTTTGLIRHHVFITGDLDGMLVFWTTWIVLHFLWCLQKERLRNGDYVALTLLFCAGFLTKSTAVLLMVPPLLAMGALYGRPFLQMLANRRFAWSILAFVLFVGAYYAIRTSYDPGYWPIVWASEFLRLTDDIQPWLHFPFTFYLENLYDPIFHEYLLLMAAVAVPYFSIRGTAHKKWSAALLLGCAVYLLFISSPPVKLSWYDAPVYPLACAVLGLMITEVAGIALKGVRPWHIGAGLVLLTVVAITIRNSFARVKNELDAGPHTDQAHQTVPDALKFMHDRHPHVAHFAVLVPPVSARFAHTLDELTFYKRTYELQEQKTVSVSDELSAFRSGDTIICNRESAVAAQQQYELKRLDSTAAGAMWVELKTKPASGL